MTVVAISRAQAFYTITQSAAGAAYTGVIAAGAAGRAAAGAAGIDSLRASVHIIDRDGADELVITVNGDDKSFTGADAFDDTLGAYGSDLSIV